MPVITVRIPPPPLGAKIGVTPDDGKHEILRKREAALRAWMDDEWDLVEVDGIRRPEALRPPRADCAFEEFEVVQNHRPPEAKQAAAARPPRRLPPPPAAPRHPTPPPTACRPAAHAAPPPAPARSRRQAVTSTSATCARGAPPPTASRRGGRRPSRE